MLKAVILDFDGLIIDSEVIWFDIFQKWFLEKFNYVLPLEQFLWCVGSGSKVLFKHLYDTKGFEIDKQQFDFETIDEFILRSEHLPAKAGIIELIEEVKKQDLKLALVTSSKVERPTYHLTRLNLIDDFEFLVTANDVENIKPNPEPFNLALEKLGIVASEAMVFEDSKSGLTAAKAAGIPTIVIPNEVTKFSDFHGYYQKIDTAEDVNLIEIIKSEIYN